MPQEYNLIEHKYDVVVVGGSTGAVAAAVEAARAGGSVFLAAGRPYLGDDVDMSDATHAFIWKMRR